MMPSGKVQQRVLAGVREAELEHVTVVGHAHGTGAVPAPLDQVHEAARGLDIRDLLFAKLAVMIHVGRDHLVAALQTRCNRVFGEFGRRRGGVRRPADQ